MPKERIRMGAAEGYPESVAMVVLKWERYWLEWRSTNPSSVISSCLSHLLADTAAAQPTLHAQHKTDRVHL